MNAFIPKFATCFLGWTLAVLCCNSPDAKAQSQDDSEVSQLFEMPLEALLDIYVSSPSQSRRAISRAPSIITSIGAVQIVAMGASTLSDLLKMLPGIQVLNRRNGQDMVWIRGIPSGRNTKMMLMIDGVPQREVIFGGWSPDEQIGIDNIARLEVIRGPGSALYGGDAYSGLISIFTKKKVPESTRLSGQLGSFATKKLSLQSGKTFADTAVLLSASLFDTDGYAQQKDRAGAPSEHNNNVEASRINTRISNTHWDAAITFDDYTTEYPSYSSAQYKSQQYQTLSSYVKHHTDLGNWLVEHQLFQYRVNRHFDRQNNNPDGSINFSSYSELETDLTGLRSQWQYSHNPSHSSIIGAIYQRQSVDQYHETITLKNGLPIVELESIIQKGSDRTPSADNYAIYIQQESAFWADTVAVTAGVRWDRFSEFGSEISPKLAFTYRGSESWSSKIIWGTAFRPPTFLQQYEIRSDGNSPGNPDINAELIETLEAEWLYHFDDKSNLSIRGFSSTLKDFIQSVGGAPYQNVDQQLKVPGFELEYNHKIPLTWSSFNELGLTLNYTRVNTHQPSVARDNANLMLFAENHTMGLYLGVNYLGRRNEGVGYHSAVKVPQFEEQDNKGNYWIVDANIRFKALWGSKWQLTLGLQNLFNKQYYNPTYAPDSYYDVRKQPRSFNLGLSVDF